MNILYCGDKNIEDGLIISILSLLDHATEPLHVYILTAALDLETARCEPVTDTVLDFLNALLNNRDGGSVRKIDVTEHFMACLPEKNLGTRFTPCCMLRLFADQVEEIPDRILYLDADVVCRKNIRDFYHQDMTGWELAGVLDHYGFLSLGLHQFRRIAAEYGGDPAYRPVPAMPRAVQGQENVHAGPVGHQ